VTTVARSPVLASVPTVAEAGLPGYDTGLWWGVVAPAGLPPAVKAKLERSVAEAVKAPGVSQPLLGLGAAPVGSTSDNFAALIRPEYGKWGPVIKAAGIRGEWDAFSSEGPKKRFWSHAARRPGHTTDVLIAGRCEHVEHHLMLKRPSTGANFRHVC
jgi:hypothetical protein